MAKTVVFFNPYADSDVKGAARRIEFLSGLLIKAGISCRVILKADYVRSAMPFLERLALRLRLLRVAYFLFAWRLCREAEYVVISEVIFSPAWLSNFVLTIHDLKTFDAKAKRRGRSRKFAYVLFARLAQKIVVVSEAVRNDVIEHCKVHAERVHVLYNGISERRLAIARDSRGVAKTYDFVYVSSFARHKRHAMLIDAAPTGARICLVGRDLGTLQQAKERIAMRSGEIHVDIFDNVHSDAQLFKCIASAHCGIFPSVFEGFGIPLLEYAATGVYIIATDIPPFRELAPYIDRFVAADDTVALSTAMLDFMRIMPVTDSKAFECIASGPFSEAAILGRLCDLLDLTP